MCKICDEINQKRLEESQKEIIVIKRSKMSLKKLTKGLGHIGKNNETKK